MKLSRKRVIWHATKKIQSDEKPFQYPKYIYKCRRRDDLKKHIDTHLSMYRFYEFYIFAMRQDLNG